MDSRKKSFGEWLLDIVVGIVRGALWLFETIPLTAIVVLPLGFVVMIVDWEIAVPSNRFIWFTVIMLIDGYVGHRHAERKKQQLMQDFYCRHAEELEKDRGER